MVEAIELARALGNFPQPMVVYGIEGKNFAAGIGLSAEVEKAAGETVRQALAMIQYVDSNAKLSHNDLTAI